MDYLQAFERTTDCYGDKRALIEPDGRAVTFSELEEESTALANTIDDKAPQSRSATLATNSIPTVVSMIAGQKRGRGTVQLPFRSKSGELVSMLETADVGSFLFDEPNRETALDVINRAEIDYAVYVGDEPVEHEAVETYENALNNASNNAAEADANEYGVFYTSGTTSRPKAVPFDQEQMWLGSSQVIMEMGIERTDTALVTTPWYHMVTTDAWILPHLQAGATLVLQEQFDPTKTLSHIAEYDVTGLLAVPTQLSMLADTQAEIGQDIETLDYIRTGGSVVSEELVDRASEYLTENVYNSYGMTEGGPNFTYAHPADQEDHMSTVGKASYMWTLRVVETTALDEGPDPEREVDPGETGEIIAKGPGMCEGYLDNPEAEEKLFADGWLRTGDVAEVDEDGYLYIVDRIDNMIISGGENIYPQEVSQTLKEHPEVNDAGVVGLDDEHWGEMVAAVLSVNGNVSEEDIETFCKDHDELANFKRPRRYVLVDEDLPRTDTGTLERDRVIEEYFAE